MAYTVKIEPEALADIQDITNWYNEMKNGLGKKFQTATIKQIDCLKKNPLAYSIRYEQIRCTPVKRFPYLVHFFADIKMMTVEVLAVISTDRNPKIWLEKSAKKPSWKKIVLRHISYLIIYFDYLTGIHIELIPHLL